MAALLKTQLTSLKKIASGKVRDLYQVDDDHVLMVASDRISAYDVVFAKPVPDKGRILTGISNVWFGKLSGIIENHLTDIAPESVVAPHEIDQVVNRSVVIKKLKPIALEAVVRGYLAGSGWHSYQTSGIVCGQLMPTGLKLADALPAPIFTPTTKAPVGEHDEPVSFSYVEKQIGADMAEKIREVSIRLYVAANEIAQQSGLIIADTKFEFGLDKKGNLVLMDEMLTPDSSRLWLKDQYGSGVKPEGLDKQCLRDYLDASGWDRQPPIPDLPDAVIENIRARYLMAYQKIVGHDL